MVRSKARQRPPERPREPLEQPYRRDRAPRAPIDDTEPRIAEDAATDLPGRLPVPPLP